MCSASSSAIIRDLRKVIRQVPGQATDDTVQDRSHPAGVGRGPWSQGDRTAAEGECRQGQRSQAHVAGHHWNSTKLQPRRINCTLAIGRRSSFPKFEAVDADVSDLLIAEATDLIHERTRAGAVAV